MHGLAFNVRPQLGVQCLVCHHVHSPLEQILKEELHAEITRRRGRPIERDQDVYIVVSTCRISSDRTEERETSYTISLEKLGLACSQLLQYIRAVHGRLMSTFG